MTTSLLAKPWYSPMPLAPVFIFHNCWPSSLFSFHRNIPSFSSLCHQSLHVNDNGYPEEFLQILAIYAHAIQSLAINFYLFLQWMPLSPSKI